MELFGREVVLSMKGGSHMRNLNDENSDEDLKYFVLPTREDLFTSKVFTKFESTETLDTDVQDVRRLESLLYKSNPAYLDLLFSPDIDTFNYPEMKGLYSLRNDIAKMNLPYFYSASMGMFNQNVKDLERPTSDKVKAMIERHGYNPKKAMMAIHFGLVLIKFHTQRFANYGKAIWYEEEERDYMLNIKRGKWKLQEVKESLAIMESRMKELEEDYKAQPFDDVTFSRIQNLLRELVFAGL